MMRTCTITIRPLMALVVLGLASSACDKAKSALEDATGFKQMESDEVDDLKAKSDWNVDNIDVLMGFTLSDKFSADLSKDFEQDIGVIPDKFKQGADASGKSKAMALLRKVEIETPVKTYTRFEIVSVAKVSDDNKLFIGGDAISKYVDAKDRPSKDNGQAGDYFLVAGKEKVLSFLSGTVTLKKAGEKSGVPVGGAFVFTDSSPFATKSGTEEGKYILAMVEGAKGNVIAYKKDIGSDAKGTPESTSSVIPYTGVIPDDKKAEAASKASEFSTEGGSKIANWATTANEKVTSLLDMWALQPADLVFLQPLQAAAKVPDLAPASKPGTPTTAKPADPTPPADSPVMRTPPGEEATAPQIDLGCSGVNKDNVSTLVIDGSKYDDATIKGWRFQGDARITTEQHAEIFGAPESVDDKRYIDKMTGYCLLSTGNSQYNLSSDKSPLLLPGPDGTGKTSDMWQKVKVPKTAASIQLRVAFFSQEYPKFVGTQFNDSFLIKFDESISVIASGNLNDLAGGNNGADLSKCRSTSGITKGQEVACGEWEPVANTDGLTGELWDIASSTQAVGGGNQFGCMKSDVAGKCYHGWIKPRVICKTLSSDEKDKELTLRMSVSDAGDAVYDSALAVDSIVFSTQGCDAADLFSGDRASQVSEVPAAVK